MSRPPKKRSKGKMVMSKLFRSDLFRSLASGFLMGTAALVAMSPAEGTDSLKAKIESIYKA